MTTKTVVITVKVTVVTVVQIGGERAAVRTLKALANWIGEDEGLVKQWSQIQVENWDSDTQF